MKFIPKSIKKRILHPILNPPPIVVTYFQNLQILQPSKGIRMKSDLGMIHDLQDQDGFASERVGAEILDSGVVDLQIDLGVRKLRSVDLGPIGIVAHDEATVIFQFVAGGHVLINV